ncbi:MAG: hypothetical protein WD969_04415 [Paracoccaceae bacterium]
MQVFTALAVALFAFGATADTLTVRDQSGAEAELDTATLTGCRIIFDSAGVPFEICRMKKIELTPPSSTRARPGHDADTSAGGADVVYVKANE